MIRRVQDSAERIDSLVPACSAVVSSVIAAPVELWWHVLWVDQRGCHMVVELLIQGDGSLQGLILAGRTKQAHMDRWSDMEAEQVQCSLKEGAAGQDSNHQMPIQAGRMGKAVQASRSRLHHFSN